MSDPSAEELARFQRLMRELDYLVATDAWAECRRLADERARRRDREAAARKRTRAA